ncbi:hypothetical protein K432DRAFT_396200 [Lepidopterella palustris CBS 459.81]|uniref:1-alkyl-2-acetylglycerophosphocholine esterase n=1 Tax=Lepidopterella palustris CBS 459.81 TaxID=1314670 RepID=A0A8E2JBX2_9PEZI|nr:hypothetical protein K432DRAFT_396200 [Lepidopterella palustris CBS 459.81]
MSLPARTISSKSVKSDIAPNSLVGTGSIPNTKKPKARPSSIWDKVGKFGFLHSTLPKYSGPYSVGAMDIEVPVERPQTFSHITRHGHYLLKLETVLMTIYYPAALDSDTGKPPSGNRISSRRAWLPRPRAKIAKGFSKCAGLGDFAVPWFVATTMFTRLPAFKNPKPAAYWPPADYFEHGGAKAGNMEGPPPEGEPKEPMFPLMFFSHGLGGTRTAYSSVCGEFASYGFVVCALEHRDGSGPRTYVNHAKQGVGSMEERDQHEHIDHSKKQREKGYDKIDYVFPQRNKLDIDPRNVKGVDLELREAQIQLRLAEIEEAYRVLCQIQEGNGEEVEKKNLRQKGYIGSSSRGLEGVDWSAWKHRFYTKRVTVAGHSFGAATTVEVLRHADRFHYAEQGIMYDIWGAVIAPPKDEPRHRIHKPILGINSEAFMYWPSNFKAVASLMDEAREQGAPVWLCTVRGTVHINQSDLSFLYPHLSALFLKMTANPKRALDLNISASLEFLKGVMGNEGGGKAIIERCMMDEHLLQTEALDAMPTEHKPDERWIATRLKIPHEFRSRVVPQLSRKLKRRKEGGEHKPGDEVWMHVKTDGGDVTGWREKISGGGEPNERSSDNPTRGAVIA